VLPDKSVKPVSASLRPAMAQTDGTELCTLTVSNSTAEVTDPDSTLLMGGQHDHIDSLLCTVVYLRTLWPSSVLALRRSSLAVRTSSQHLSMILVALISYRTALTRVTTALTSSSCGTTQWHSFRLLTSMLSTCWSMSQ